jgi:hypothetical protein
MDQKSFPTHTRSWVLSKLAENSVFWVQEVNAAKKMKMISVERFMIIFFDKDQNYKILVICG